MRKILSGRRSSNKGEFIIKVLVSGANTFQLPIPSATPTGGGVLGFLVAWGDGSSDVIDASNYNGAAATHTYSSTGTKTIKITGAVRGWSFATFSTEAQKLGEINNWGDFRFTENETFENCINMTQIDAPDIPWFEESDMHSTFNACTKLSRIANIKNWNVQPIKRFDQFFGNCSALKSGATIGGDADISTWDVSDATSFDYMFDQCTNWNGHMFKVNTSGKSNVDMTAMFQNCDNFNNSGFTDMNAWDTSGVNDMAFMFSAAEAFNSPIGSWDVSGVVDMRSMFTGNNGLPMAFNQPIGSWDVSNVTQMQGILTFCNSFDQDLSGWKLTGINTFSNVNAILTQAIGSFGLSTANYDALLIAWDAYSYPSMPAGSTFNFGSSQYSASPSAAATAHASLITKWGGIIDGGPI